MMKRTRGNLLEVDVEALVNTVNMVGVMGKGGFAQKPRLFHSLLCRRGFCTKRRSALSP
jgi:hypothetical protein